MRYLVSLVSVALFSLLTVPSFAQTDGYWDPRFTPPDEGLGFYRPVDAIAIDPSSGDLYVGGGPLLRDTGRAVVRWTGSGWGSLPGNFNGVVFSLAVGRDGTLYAACDVTSIGGAAL